MDFLIFKEEQRAIGECMIVNNDNITSVMGYAKFKLLINEFIETGKNEWLKPALNFFLNLQLRKDFRKSRYFFLIGHFQELLETLDEKQSEEAIKKIKKHIAFQSKVVD